MPSAILSGCDVSPLVRHRLSLGRPSALCRQPGRVATLVESHQGTTWGCAFHIQDAAAVSYLHRREVSLGGYQMRVARFRPRDASQPAFPVILYVATAANPLWLGPAPVPQLAAQVTAAAGCEGPNSDYVLQLHRFMAR